MSAIDNLDDFEALRPLFAISEQGLNGFAISRCGLRGGSGRHPVPEDFDLLGRPRGVAYIAVAGSVILWSGVAAQLVNRIAVKPVLVAGMVALTSGLVYFTQVSVHGTYLGDLLPGFLLVGVGLGFSSVPISIAALAGVHSSEAGLASGLFNTTQQIGGALGIAVLSTIATSRTSDALAHGTAPSSALVHGFTAAFVVGAGIAAVGIVAALTLIRRDELEQAPEQLEPVLDLAA